MAKIAISYRREDSIDITGRIFDRLSSHYGRATVFRDIDNIPPGKDFWEHIRGSIQDSDVMLVIVGPRWLGGDPQGQPRIRAEADYVRFEVETALKWRIPVIPLLVGGASMPKPSQLPESIRNLAGLEALTVDSGRDFDHHMNRLIRTIHEIAGTAEPAGVRDTLSNGFHTSPAGSYVKREQQAAPGARAADKSFFLPLVGGIMTAIGLLHLGWFISNLLTAFSAGIAQNIFHDVWTLADVIFGFGGLIVGIVTLSGAHLARSSGIVLCLLVASSNLLWFSDNFDRGLPRAVFLGTGVTLVLAMVGAYFLLFRWPSPVDK
jgi:hypothetical protein